MRMSPSVVFASLTAALLVPTVSTAQPGVPMRRDGLWEMTMQMSAPMQMTMTTRQCTDAAQEKAGAAFRNGGPMSQGGADCKGGIPLPAPGGGWSFSSVCTMRNMTISTNGVAKGDFKSGYHMETTTHMSPAPMPQMAESHMVMDAKWLGPCPADMAPGDVIVNGRKISRPKG